ncbi:hypothetical protein GQ55_6G248900 [Panicum hallii var. hallii]|uniref:Uncharacterized protein n=1 Tax=Panicum hallii var. hallii TaxID=1504633 RepID=A0A2T7D9A9_9POAL|nr:hypothetical protein GQ55_6G248900 [Panicum hallii var. hallii]
MCRTVEAGRREPPSRPLDPPAPLADTRQGIHRGDSDDSASGRRLAAPARGPVVSSRSPSAALLSQSLFASSWCLLLPPWEPVVLLT